MEFGQIPQLQQFQADSIRKTEFVNETNPTKMIENNKEPKEVLEIIQDKVEETAKGTEVKSGDLSTYNEVPITNLSFGFNEESKDFFIKVKRGDFETQYPTDEMMRLKALQMEMSEKMSEDSA